MNANVMLEEVHSEYINKVLSEPGIEYKQRAYDGKFVVWRKHMTIDENGYASIPEWISEKVFDTEFEAKTYVDNALKV